jgi:hypothetical protein
MRPIGQKKTGHHLNIAYHAPQRGMARANILQSPPNLQFDVIKDVDIRSWPDGGAFHCGRSARPAKPPSISIHACAVRSV